MFSWICPQCGHDVPPSKTECPFCADRAREAEALAAAAPPQPPLAGQQPAAWHQAPPGYGAAPATAWQGPPVQTAPPPQPPPQYAPPQQYGAQQYPPQYAPQQQYAPPPPPPQQQYAPPPPPPQYAQPQQQGPPMPPPPAPAWQQAEPKSGPPIWLATLGVAAALLLVLGVIWYFLNSSPSGGSGATAQKTAATTTPAGDATATGTNPLQKYVEVVGLRMVTEGQKPVAKFVVVNHSDAEIDDLAANVTLVAGTSKSDEDPVGTFNFEISKIGPNDAKELTEPLKTKLKMYELPDWQNTTANVDVTSPKAQ